MPELYIHRGPVVKRVVLGPRHRTVDEEERDDDRFTWTPDMLEDVEVTPPDDAETINIVPNTPTTDDAEFKENEHPRDKGGKFSTSGGGGSSSPDSGSGYSPSNQLKQMLKKHGMQPVAGADKPTYYHAATNLKFVVHPPKKGEKDTSSHWKAVSSEGQTLGFGLGRYQLDDFIKKAIASKTPAPAAPTATPTPAVKQPQMTESVSDKFTNAKSKIEGLGYKVDHVANGATIYGKPNGDVIQYNPQTDQWVAQSAGHMAKEGKGIENLELLMSGKAPTGPAPWANYNGAKVQTGAQAEAALKQQAEAAEKNKGFSATEKQVKADIPEATQSEKAAIASYTGSAYRPINAALRKGKLPSEETLANKVKHLDSWLEKSKTGEPIKVYRKVSGHYAEILKSVMFPGAKFMDRGFISTSINNGWSGDLHFEIDVPKGSRGAYVAPMSSHPGEKEFLLPRETKFTVKSFNIISHVIQLEVDNS